MCLTSRIGFFQQEAQGRVKVASCHREGTLSQEGDFVPTWQQPLALCHLVCLVLSTSPQTMTMIKDFLAGHDSSYL